MVNKASYYVLILSIMLFSCSDEAKKNDIKSLADDTIELQKLKDSLSNVQHLRLRDSLLSGADSNWVDLSILLPDAKFDIRYAGTNNFMQTQTYDCPACYVRLIVAKSLIAAEKSLDSLGLGFIFYDCYRPASAQWKLWEKMPDPRYVLPPNYGSNHSRGIAVDLGLIDRKNGKILDMGSAFDHFGVESWLSYKDHSDTVKKNRLILLNVMQNNNFSFYNREWWHFDFKRKDFSLSDFKWNCN